jgi:hypothetical protein
MPSSDPAHRRTCPPRIIGELASLLDFVQPQLDQPQHRAIRNATTHRLEQIVMRNRIEIARQISIHDIGVAPAQMPYILDCVRRPACAGTARKMLPSPAQR